MYTQISAGTKFDLRRTFRNVSAASVGDCPYRVLKECVKTDIRKLYKFFSCKSFVKCPKIQYLLFRLTVVSNESAHERDDTCKWIYTFSISLLPSASVFLCH